MRQSIHEKHDGSTLSDMDNHGLTQMRGSRLGGAEGLAALALAFSDEQGPIGESGATRWDLRSYRITSHVLASRLMLDMLRKGSHATISLR